jgi:acyl-CoA reductase-like NAD-dependent aldehyde dehydrogenase
VRRTTPRERSAYLRAVAAVIRDHAGELAELEAREVGKPRRDALRFDVSYCSAAWPTAPASPPRAARRPTRGWRAAYGLTCALITEDHFRASRLAERLEAGMVFVNNYMRRSFLGTPFGGVKGSGFGRENAPDTLREFVRAKNIRFPSGKQPVPGWPPRD